MNLYSYESNKALAPSIHTLFPIETQVVGLWIGRENSGLISVGQERPGLISVGQERPGLIDS